MTKDDGATPEPERASDCKMDGTKAGPHHWVWTDGIDKSWRQHCTRCTETRAVDPKAKNV